MRIPSFWAEATISQQHDGKSVVIRRYGWSDTGEPEAKALAQARAEEAAAQLAAGESVVRREPRKGYGGADGTPIREEIIEQRGDSVLTRNSYGAVCLNTPDVLFVDIDDESFEPPVLGNASLWTAGIVMAVLVGVSVNMQYSPHGWLLAALILCATAFVGLRRGREGEAAGRQRKGAALERVRRQIDSFIAAHPDWLLRLYQTPGGLRLMATHRTFAPDDAEAQACFETFQADPIYVRMCLSQRCFRARVSAKPWRMGLRRGLPQAQSHWPVAPAQRQAREQWVADYDAKAQRYAACHFIEAFGSGTAHPRALAVQDWHCLLYTSPSPRD